MFGSYIYINLYPSLLPYLMLLKKHRMKRIANVRGRHEEWEKAQIVSLWRE